MAAVKEKESKVSQVFLDFKSFLLFIYELVHTFINTLSGKTLFKFNNASKLPGCAGDNNNQAKEIGEIPGPRTLPFFGTLLTSKEMSMLDLKKANEDRVAKYGTVVKEEHFWNYPMIMVLGGEDIKKIVRANPTMRPGMDILIEYRTSRPDRYDTLGLVNSQGPTWKKLYGIFSIGNTNKKLVRSLHEGFHEIVDEIIDSVTGKSGPTNALPLAINRLIEEASFYIAFGQRVGFAGCGHDIPKKYKVFTSSHEVYWNAFHKSVYGFPWWKYVPSKIWDEFVQAEDDMINLIDEISDELMQSGKAGGILGAVSKDEITKNDLNVCLLEMITGATGPVYNTLLITLYWISKYEHVYNKILEELREVMPTKDSEVDGKVLENIPYLKACVMEAFRICPSTCNNARCLDQDMEIGGYKLPKFTFCLLQTWHASLQDTNFYRAKEFLPERWLLEDGVPPFRPHERIVMCNFGLGSRSCPGRKIAEDLMYTFLCKMLRKFRVKFEKELNIQYEWLLVVKNPVTVEFIENDS